MKYYQDVNGDIYAYEEDGSQDSFIGDKKPVTPEEVEKILNPPPTEKELIATAEVKKNSLISEATVKISPLLDAKEGGYIDEEDLPVLTAWQKYRYAVTKVDVNKPVWPEKPA